MDDDQLTPEGEAELVARLEATVAELRARWPKRPPPEQLTTELIAATADDALDDLVLEFVDRKRPADFTGEDYSWLHHLPIGVRLMWCSIAAEGELNNGGFNQFFFNGTDALAPGAIAGFEAIGAEPFAVLIKEAVARAENMPRKLRGAGGRALWTISWDRTKRGSSRTSTIGCTPCMTRSTPPACASLGCALTLRS